MRKVRRVSAATIGLLVAASTAVPAGAALVAGQVDNFEDGTVQDWSAGGLANPNGPANVATGGPAGASDNFMRLTANGSPSAGGRLVAFNFTQWAGDYLDEAVSAVQMQVNNLGSTALTLRLILSNTNAGQSLCTVAPVDVPAGSGWSTVSFSLLSGNLDGGGFGEFETVMAGVTELNLVHSPNVIFFRSGATNIAAQLGVDNITAVGTPAIVYYWDTNGSTAGAGGTVPSGNWDGVAANFNTDATGGGAGTIAASPGGPDTVVFSAGSGATGSYAVAVTGTRTAAQLKVEEGSVTLTGGTLAVGTFDVAAGAGGTVASVVTGAAGGGGVIKKGAGTLTFTASNSYTGGTTVEAGTLEVKKMQTGNAVNISGGTLRVLHSDPTGANLESGDDAFVSQPSSLTIAPGATLDLTNNDLILDYTGPSPVAALEALVRTAYNLTGDWAGPGITSSIAAVDGNYIVAIADNATLAAPFGAAQGGPLFAGVDVDLDTVLIKFTHRADINLDGLVTPDDSAVFGGNYDENQPAVWATGDMNYDGVFTPDDAAIFGGAYDESLTTLPEPVTAGAMLLLVPALSRGRRRATPSLGTSLNANDG